jgi:PAB1-binding protein PBP1
VVVWQTVLLRRAQRQLNEAEARAAQAVERAAMAATLSGAPTLPGDEPPAAPAPPPSAAAAGARLRAAR